MAEQGINILAFLWLFLGGVFLGIGIGAWVSRKAGLAPDPPTTFFVCGTSLVVLAFVLFLM